MKISRRRKYNKRSKYTKRVKYTRHTKHGGKHYKNKRTYRKHPRKLKHKSRLQRGGVFFIRDGKEWISFPDVYNKGTEIPLKSPDKRKVFFTFHGEKQKQVIKIENMALHYLRTKADDADDADSDDDSDKEDRVLEFKKRVVIGNFSCEVVLMEIIVYPLNREPLDRERKSKHEYKFMIKLSDTVTPSEDFRLSTELSVLSYFNDTYEAQIQAAIHAKKPRLLPNLPNINVDYLSRMVVNHEGELEVEHGLIFTSTQKEEEKFYFPKELVEEYSNKINFKKITDAITELRNRGERLISNSYAAGDSHITA